MMRQYPWNQRRRGMTAVLAMLFLVLFSTLAVGFYTAVGTSVQIASNDQRGSRAYVAAESGMAFARYHLLKTVALPATLTDHEAVFAEVFSDLSYGLNGTLNLGGGSVSRVGDVIYVPANGYVPLNMLPDGTPGQQFRLTIEKMADRVRVTSYGRWGAASAAPSVERAVQLTYARAENASKIFNYGVASEGTIKTDGNAKIRGNPDPSKGSVLSAAMNVQYPVEIYGTEVSGDISIVNKKYDSNFPLGGGALVYVKSSSTVGGTSNPNTIHANHVHYGVEKPEFPTIDSSAFRAFATNTYVAGKGPYVNVVVPPNTNPKFEANAQIQGVLYIQSPNNVYFAGGAQLQGVIVTDEAPTGTVSTNVLDFAGSFTARGVETLPESFGELRKLTGSFILAPKFHLKFAGSFGTVNGSIVGSQLTMAGGAAGTVNGTVINLENYPVSVAGQSEVIIASTGTTNYPSGVRFSSHFAPLADTYMEVQQ